MRNLRLRRELLELLRITAPSGYEAPVANYLVNKLSGMTDTVSTDDYGNVVAERTYGDGSGPVILLSAHMDTVWVEPGRTVICDGDIWRSSEGPLGADDRAGIAIILDVLVRLSNLPFQGKLKLAFTREEEIGCVGSGCLDEDWLDGTDLAIVVDRRGSRDIVTHNRSLDFCGPQVAAFFAGIGRRCGMPDWSPVRGGVSDAVTYALCGIPSVNLSAGYWNEHTEEEFVDVRSCEDTSRFVTEALLHWGSRMEQERSNRRNESTWRPGRTGTERTSGTRQQPE
jgi:putative aminopeptidase FrvX